MPASPLRYKRLIKELPKHKSARDALIASGFSESTANKQSKSVLRSAIKHEAKELLQSMDNKETSTKQLMSELLGISRNELFDRLKYIAIEQEKDFGSAIKILTALSKEHGIALTSEEDNKGVTVPVLNITVDKTNVIEGAIDNTLIEAPVDDDTM